MRPTQARRRRPPVDRLVRAVAAAVALVALLVGPPLLLGVFIGNPWPTGGVSLQAPMTDEAIIGLLAAVCWVLWAQVAACVLAEIAAAMRGVSIPVRVPATFGVQQQLARILVSCVVTVTVAGPFTAGVASMAPAQPVHRPPVSTLASAVVRPHLEPAHPNRAHLTSPQPEHLPTVRVARGDSLWSLAEAHLGSGERWTAIAQLNRGHTMNDGTVFRSENLLLPGWQLVMPASSTGLAPDTAESASSGRPATVTVEPGDTLSGIAEDALGDGDAWPALWEANKALVDDPNLILPGWHLVLPDAAPGLGPQRGDQHDPMQPPPNPTHIRHPHPPAPTHDAPGLQLPPAQTPPQPPTGGTQDGTGSSFDHPVQNSAGTHVGDDADTSVSVRAVCGVGSLAAVGVIALLGGRRMRQHRRRKVGGRIPMPTGAAAALETDLRTNQDPGSVQTVDRVLRSLAISCQTAGRPLPAVSVVRLTGTQLELYLAAPTILPPPWTFTADETVWAIERTAVDPSVAVALHDVAAPYPALVTLGVDEHNAHIMVDLEHLGTLGLIGDDDPASQLLLALAVELSTSSWADDLVVTVVGAQPGLERTLRTGRVRYRTAAGDVIDELTHQAEQARSVLAETGIVDLRHARVDGDAPGLCTPEIVLFASALTETQAHQLHTATLDLPRVAVAAVTTGTHVAQWALRFTGVNAAVLEPLGLHIQPQHLNETTCAQLLELLEVADQEPKPGTFDVLPEPTLADARAGYATDTPVRHEVPLLGDPVPASAPKEREPVTEQRTTDSVDDAEITGVPSALGLSDAEPSTETPDADSTHDLLQGASPEPGDGPVVGALVVRIPRLLVLGRPEVTDPQGPSRSDDRPAQTTELVAFLALHGPATAAQIDQAFWPGRRVGNGTRDTFVSRARTWLGSDSDGNPCLLRYSLGDLYRLSDTITTDWDDLRRLVGPDPQHASTGDLEQALSMVRGRPFKGVRDDRYAWADIDANEMIATISDVSYELARRRLMDGKLRGVHTAALVGLGVEPGCERLSRLRIEAAAAAGDPSLVDGIIRTMYAVADQTDSDLEPKTTVLLAQLRATDRTDQRNRG